MAAELSESVHLSQQVVRQRLSLLLLWRAPVAVLLNRDILATKANCKSAEGSDLEWLLSGHLTYLFGFTVVNFEDLAVRALSNQLLFLEPLTIVNLQHSLHVHVRQPVIIARRARLRAQNFRREES